MESNTELNEKNTPAIHEETGNLTICPNCLEPNSDDLAVCRYCGMPLHSGAEGDLSVIEEDEEKLAASRAAAVPAEKKEAKKEEGGFRRAMPWIGLYIIYYAITGIIDTSNKIKADPEGAFNPTLAYASWGIYIIAGLLMCWPLIKKGWNKIHPAPEVPEQTPDEEPVSDEREDAEEAEGSAEDLTAGPAEETISMAEAEPEDGKDTDEENEDPSEGE